MSILRRTTALIAAATLMQPALAGLALAEDGAGLVTLQPNPGPEILPYFVHGGDGRWKEHDRGDDDRMIARLREKVKYVFVIFNENHSFDNEYGTFPGVNGIYSDGRAPRSPANTPGFTQTYTDLNGTQVTVQPFRLGPAQNSTFRDSVDHSHTGLARKIDVVNGVPRMDQFSYDEYYKYAKAGINSSQAQGLQFSRLVMSHVDCDTIPFFWNYANRFTIFDNIFATEDTPSTPNAVAMIAGQAGETQWVKHPGPTTSPTSTGFTGPISGTINGTTYAGVGTTQGPPLVNDPNPWWGSQFDATAGAREPTSPREFYGPISGSTYNVASNLTFATIQLAMMGKQAGAITAQDANPALDLPDVQQDVAFLDKHGGKPVDWRWYQNGYDVEPTDVGAVASHANYVAHHQGPQYFGYLANNPAEAGKLGGEGDFFNDIVGGKLPKDGGVVYIRGGFGNLKGQLPPIQNPNYPDAAGLTATEIAKIDASKAGDDDHPAYSDGQISEGMAARVINAIAANQDVWEHSAIIITYDESDGFYDHVPPRVLSYGPDGLPLSRGVRIPLLLISPYARVHAVSHAEGDHNAVLETIEAIFGLPALSHLPDEAQALTAGNSPAFNAFAPAGFQQTHLGPRDTNTKITDSLLSAFEPARLEGWLPPLPGSYAMIPDSVVNSLPHYAGKGCAAIGVTPEDVRQGIVNTIPANFNSLPSTLSAYN